MSIPTVNQLAQVLMREFGEDVANTQITSQVEAWIQDVFDEIGVAAEWKYLWNIDSLVTVASTRVYTLTGSLDQEIAVKIDEGNVPLFKQKRQDFYEAGVNLNQTGKPTHWYTESLDTSNEKFTVGLFPVPDSVYNISFLGLLQPTELTSNTVLPFPREFIFLLKDGVRIKFKEDDKDYSGAERIRPRFTQSLNKLKARNDNEIAIKPRMGIMDISSSRDVFVSLPKDHFPR